MEVKNELEHLFIQALNDRDLDKAKELFQMGAKADLPRFLKEAMSEGDMEKAVFIIDDLGVNVNDYIESESINATPLHYATSQCSVEYVRLLLEKGALHNMPSRDGYRAMDILTILARVGESEESKIEKKRLLMDAAMKEAKKNKEN